MNIVRKNGLFNRACIRLIRLYQLLISPLFPPACRFYPSCSRYAVDALQKRPLLVALAKIIWRLLRCNPFSRGGYDPVDPDPPTPNTEESRPNRGGGPSVAP